MKLCEILSTFELIFVIYANPPPFPSEEVLFVIKVCDIVVLPFKFTNPIAPPLDWQLLFVNSENTMLPYELKIAKAPPRHDEEEQ